MRLLLIRHGQTPHNVAGVIDTAFPGAGLTPLGHSQAAAIPDALVGENIAGIYASKLVRTQLTAAPLATSLGQKVRIRDGFEEVSAGSLELRADAEAVHEYDSCLASWMCGDLERRMPGGPTGHEFLDRYQAPVRALAVDHDEQDTVVVFSHGAAIRVFTALAVGLDAKACQELRIKNTGMSLLEGHPRSGWNLAQWSSEPLGGRDLEDPHAHDVTGESVEEANDARELSR